MLNTSERLGKVYKAISNLPSTPTKKMYWIVYNQDMISYTEDLIAQVHGKDYLNHITVVAKNGDSKQRQHGTVYFDPGLYDLLGNGGI
jgi:hypothetical protein